MNNLNKNKKTAQKSCLEDFVGTKKGIYRLKAGI